MHLEDQCACRLGLLASCTRCGVNTEATSHMFVDVFVNSSVAILVMHIFIRLLMRVCSHTVLVLNIHNHVHARCIQRSILVLAEGKMLSNLWYDL